MSDGQTNLTLRQRLRLQKSAGSADSTGPGPAESSSKRRVLRNVGIAAIMLLLAGGAAWAWMYFHPGVDPRYQEIADLQAKIKKIDDPFSSEARDLHKQIWAKMKDLPDDLRSKVMENGRGMMQQRFSQFFAMSSQDQLATLDKFIAGFQAMEALRQARDAIAGQPAANANAGSNGNSSNGSSGSGNQSHGHWGGRSETQRMQGMQKMLSNLSPAQRGQWTMGRQMFNARLQQQGGTPPSGGFF